MKPQFVPKMMPAKTDVYVVQDMEVYPKFWE
jgi:hypothetical protein